MPGHERLMKVRLLCPAGHMTQEPSLPSGTNGPMPEGCITASRPLFSFAQRGHIVIPILRAAGHPCGGCPPRQGEAPFSGGAAAGDHVAMPQTARRRNRRNRRFREKVADSVPCGIGNLYGLLLPVGVAEYENLHLSVRVCRGFNRREVRLQGKVFLSGIIERAVFVGCPHTGIQR